MILSDLVSSISDALPRLVAASAQRPPDEKLFGPDVGYAFFQPAGLRTRDRFDLDPAEAWSRLRSTTVGILGMDSTSHAVAHAAHQRFGADVVHRQPRPVGTGYGTDARSASLDEILSARVLCVVLPWGRDQLAQVRRNKLALRRAGAAARSGEGRVRQQVSFRTALHGNARDNAASLPAAAPTVAGESHAARRRRHHADRARRRVFGPQPPRSQLPGPDGDDADAIPAQCRAVKRQLLHSRRPGARLDSGRNA